MAMQNTLHALADPTRRQLSAPRPEPDPDTAVHDSEGRYHTGSDPAGNGRRPCGCYRNSGGNRCGRQPDP